MTPFSHFQLTLADKNDTFLLLAQLNKSLGDDAIDPEILKDGFEKYWPEFEEMLGAIPLGATHSAVPKRSQEDMLEEILSLVREGNRLRMWEEERENMTGSPVANPTLKEEFRKPYFGPRIDPAPAK